VLYTERRYADAFCNDLIGYGGYAAAVGGLYYLNALTAPRAMYALAVTALVAAAVGCWRIRASLSPRVEWSAVRENWDYGKWLAGGSMLRWFGSAQMFQYLAAILLGTWATATLKSAQIVLGPTRVLATSLTTVLPTRFARTHAAAGKAGLHRQLKSTYLLVAPVMGAYCLAVAVFAGPLLSLLYPDGKYAGGETVLRLYALSSFLAYNLHFAGSALRAGRLTRDVFRISLWTGVVAVVLGCVFIKAFGVNGAMVAMIATGLLSNVLYWLAYRRHLTEADEEASEDRGERQPAGGKPAPAADVAMV
jgi:O-antigen/teichoic acid export membrane protein